MVSRVRDTGFPHWLAGLFVQRKQTAVDRRCDNLAVIDSDPPVHAATDVTGFGLVGHLLEMARGSGLGFELLARSVPLFDLVLDLAAHEVVPGGTRSNLENALASGVSFEPSVSNAMQLTLCDAQTSGGLLIAVSRQFADELSAALNHHGVETVSSVGALTAQATFAVRDR